MSNITKSIQFVVADEATITISYKFDTQNTVLDFSYLDSSFSSQYLNKFEAIALRDFLNYAYPANRA